MTPRAILAIVLTACLMPISLGWAAGQQQAFPFVGQVTTDQVNIRAGQSANFERVCQLGKGEEVLVLEKQFSWFKIQLPPQANCYIHKEYVQFLGQNAGGILADQVNIRAGAGIHFTVLGQVNKGETVTIEEELGDWYRIRPVPASYGWVTDDFLAFKSADTSDFNPPVAQPKWEPPVVAKGEIPEYAAEEPESSQKPIVTEVETQLIVKQDEVEPIRNEIAVKDASSKKAAEQKMVETAEKAKVTAENVREKQKLSQKPIVFEAKTKLTDKQDEIEPIRSETAVKAVPSKKAAAQKVVEKTEKAKVTLRQEEKPVQPKPQKADIPSPVVAQFEIPENGILSVVGYVEPFEPKGEDGIFYKIVQDGQPVCYVQGPNQMLGRFMHQKVAVEGVVNKQFLTKHSFPVLSVSKIRLMI